jgi:hypothetical protein
MYRSAWKKDARGKEYRQVTDEHGNHIRFEVRHGKGQNFTLRFGKKQHEEAKQESMESMRPIPGKVGEFRNRTPREKMRDRALAEDRARQERINQAFNIKTKKDGQNAVRRRPMIGDNLLDIARGR